MPKEQKKPQVDKLLIEFQRQVARLTGGRFFENARELQQHGRRAETN